MAYSSSHLTAFIIDFYSAWFLSWPGDGAVSFGCIQVWQFSGGCPTIVAHGCTWEQGCRLAGYHHYLFVFLTVVFIVIAILCGIDSDGGLRCLTWVYPSETVLWWLPRHCLAWMHLGGQCFDLAGDYDLKC